MPPKLRLLVKERLVALDYFAELDETVHVRRIGQTDYAVDWSTV